MASGEPRAKQPRAAVKPPYGFWAGGWAFVSSPAPGWQAGLRDPGWWPERRHGELQLGIPNRLHGSDHLPIVCTLMLQGEPSTVEPVVVDADSEPDDQGERESRSAD
ncbi:unnamed protein product [Prorocentrum cordatum]|uniref:DNA-(apurinic or apyrimidinic site) endonuclease n=1 Tax=Prorocentrum cordatum TaxID=2364126 RepID=A0ABN9UGJ5_9DINO|nr:unnamed protein product [Polarella glacialis]